jgi:hypothetical protein
MWLPEQEEQEDLVVECCLAAVGENLENSRGDRDTVAGHF